MLDDSNDNACTSDLGRKSSAGVLGRFSPAAGRGDLGDKAGSFFDMQSHDGSNPEFGMPATEDSDNLPTMGQLKLNFNVDSSSQAEHSMRSGVFGGFNHSIDNETPSFAGNNMMAEQSPGQVLSNRVGSKTPSLTKSGSSPVQPKHSSVETFGGLGGKANTLDQFNVCSPLFRTSDDGREEKEDAMTLTDVGIDQDFDFIEDDIAVFMSDIQSKVSVLSQVRLAFEKGKRKIPEKMQDTVVSEVQNLEENFQKVIGYTCKCQTIAVILHQDADSVCLYFSEFLVDKVRKFQE